MTRSSENGTTVYQNDSDLEDPTLDDDKESGFMLLYEAGLSTVVEKIATDELQHKDLTVLMIHVSHSDWRTGRCRLTTQMVAENSAP